ncbi:MFS transporter [Burkholderia sp. Ac-20353]|uniref:spinster family MFS transporter n=1 Tax=Burkholderia sp. Ac-20353 TaxID=2703894 RepID=UPI00197C24C1|nr:MFS transporter [Burkholderia sp. Ac-20353]MBN3785968.1 MFS transporter [Burkholderia sp. Ac-20353]
MLDDTQRPTATPTPIRAGGYRWLVLVMLLLVYALNWIDRQIIGILVIPIKHELGLTDTQLGTLGGVAFAIFYAGLGVPIAWLADRKSRTWIVTISLGLWSLFTALCGMATSFWQMFAYRMGVGVGEAGGVAPSFALITDYFPRHLRSRAIAIYAFGIPIGSAAGIMLGGWIANTVNWRTAFIAVGLAGLLLTPVFRALVREPVRAADAAASEREPADPPSLTAIVALLVRKRSFLFLALGSSLASLMNYGLVFWLPAFFSRTFSLGLMAISVSYGAVVLVGGVLGVWLGGWLGDRFGPDNPSTYVRAGATMLAASVPFYVAGLMMSSPYFALLLFVVPAALSYVWFSPIISSIQLLAPPPARATASACFLFINNLIGVGLGSLILGALSDAMRVHFGTQSLRYSILCGLTIYLVAAVLFAIASRYVNRDCLGGNDTTQRTGAPMPTCGEIEASVPDKAAGLFE